jgi:hypothetical protein
MGRVMAGRGRVRARPAAPGQGSLPGLDPPMVPAAQVLAEAAGRRAELALDQVDPEPTPRRRGSCPACHRPLPLIDVRCACEFRTVRMPADLRARAGIESRRGVVSGP